MDSMQEKQIKHLGGGSDDAQHEDTDRQSQESTVKQDMTVEHGQPAPDGGYGWVVVACVFWLQVNTWGINGSYGIFLSHYMTNDVFPGTSSFAYSMVGGLSIGCAYLMAPFTVYLIRTHGTHATLIGGIIVQSGGLIAASFATRIWQLFLAQGVCFGTGMGVIYMTYLGIPAQWFERKRSIANAIPAAGAGTGGIIYSLAIQSMIENIGLGWTYRTLALVSLTANLVSAAFLRDRHKATASRHTAFQFPLLRRAEFVLLLGWAIFSTLGFVAVNFSLPNFAVSIGLSSHQSSVVGALHNLGQGVGRPLIGLLSDRWGRLNVASVLSLVCAGFCFAIWIPAQDMAVVSVFATIGGMVSGTFFATVAPVIVEVIGLQDLPGALSILWLVLISPGAFGEAIAQALRRPAWGTAAYQPVQVFSGILYIAAALCLWFVRGWKVQQKLREESEQASRHKDLTDVVVCAKEGEGEEVVRKSVWRDPVGLGREMVRWYRV
ncbi:MFS general substrate transporter [Aspergillus uvarum CBS 121591]|uniref:MFS general substrate transporter n=1 Tax=Aspergillus uvarum CBS 121591 TaxID=1448315 RepID=A0A319CJ27_9EURO|nr:MFS general substrate transporter [Aspergillus uvarum CBS 121591]PYH85675.1 MFS general substrate transporter [Aspergillus uvarum CBS 121591]